jgi:thiol-disulfide isomerase/thioredoxin
MRRGVFLAAGLICLVCAAASAAEALKRPRLAVFAGADAEHVLRPAPGRPLLVHLWASWCRPCVSEWPAFAAWLRRVPGEGVDIVNLSIDEAEARGAAEGVLARLGPLPGRSLAASLDDIFPAIHALDPEWDGALPTTFLLDGDGRVVLAQRGSTRADALGVAIERLAPGNTKILGAKQRTQ